jgi:hypothetical protein
MLAEKGGPMSTTLWPKLDMPDEKLEIGCYDEAFEALSAW